MALLRARGAGTQPAPALRRERVRRSLAFTLPKTIELDHIGAIHGFGRARAKKTGAERRSHKEVSVRLVHTADWHLGQTLGGFSRDAEHGRFLAWLLDRLEEERADALLLCGDVFDQGNPPAHALARYYELLAEARRRVPSCAIVVIGGNHDSAPRLDAPGPVLKTLGAHVTGALPRDGAGQPDPERCLVPLVGPSGDVEAWCAAVPFLRVADLPPVAALANAEGAPSSAPDPLVQGVAHAYQRVLDAARASRRPGQALVALGHCHMQGGRLTEESERALFGNAHALPVDIFPDDVGYAALGHLHFAQEVGGRREVRYSGSPIPLSMTERDYRHQVLVVDLEGERLAGVRPLPVPRHVELLRLPEVPGALDDVLDRLRALELPDVPEDERPFLEVRVRLEAPAFDLRGRIELALEGKPVRLVRVHRELAGAGSALADSVTAASLADIEPARVLERLYERSYGGAVPEDVALAFAELVESVRERGAPGGSS
jgi:DNA repair protein SbcD/Mre11